jgi:predicted house-cleaning noncanonical NTP pyrophosphatase (MazG superfamily)
LWGFEPPYPYLTKRKKEKKMLPKLVRDKIPALLEDTGKRYKAHIAESPEYEMYLIKKMNEEIGEFAETPCLDEAADVYEVFLAVLDAWKLNLADVQLTAGHKKDIRGAFRYGIILEEIYED